MNKSYPLAIVNAAEDIPRIIRAFANLGRDRGECALVIRPLENRAVLVHQHNGQAWQWIGERSDVVRPPEQLISPEGALSLLRQAQQNKGKQGDISFRSQWTGRLFCDDGQPRIHLERKIASYGILHVDSDAKAGKWKWHIERAEKWFSKPGKQSGTSTNLVQAIQQGMATAMGLLGEACSFRDSRRRAAFDEDYAERHPVKPAAEKKDPVDRFKPKKAKTTRRKSTTSKSTSAKTTTAKTTKAAPKTTKATKATGTSSATSTGAAKSAGSNTAKTSKSSSSRTTSTTKKAPTRKAPSAQTKTPSAASPALPPSPAGGGPAPEIDPAKDKLLMDAFSAALQQALSQMGA